MGTDMNEEEAAAKEAMLTKVTMDVDQVLDWLDEWSNRLGDMSLENSTQAHDIAVQQFTIEVVKSYLLHSAMYIWKRKYETAFDLPNKEEEGI